MADFYPLTAEALSKLYSAGLTAAEWRLWTYLSVLDPWGDRYKELPDTLTIIQEVGIKKTTFYSAISKLQRFDLFDFQDKGFFFRNLKGSANRSKRNTENPSDDGGYFPKNRTAACEQDSEKSNRIPKNRTAVREIEQDSENLKNQQLEALQNKASEPLQTIQTFSDFSHSKEGGESVKNVFQNPKKDLSEGLKEDFEKQPEEESKDAGQTDNPSSGVTIPPATAETQIQKTEPFFNRKPTPTQIEWKWLPDGAWKTEQGTLDHNFHSAIAKRWMSVHGGDFHDKMVNVLKHFRNNPTNLPIEWEWYQNKILHKAANIETRKAAGIDTTTDEKEILKHHRAGTELPQEMRVTEERSPKEILQEVAPHTLRAIEAPSDEYGYINPDSFQLKECSADDRAFWQKIYSPQLNQATQSTDSSAKGEASVAIDLVDDQKKAAKELIENLRRRHEEKRKRREENQEKGDKNLTPIGEIIYPPAETPFSVILEDMRKYLNCGSDAYRRIAIDWACDPINGCELVRARTGWIVDIRELDF